MSSATSNNGVSQLVSDVVLTCLTNNISVMLSAEKSIIYTDEITPVNGWFCGETKQLAAATGKDISEWLPVLIHESCHMDQFIENASAWTEITMPDGREATNVLFSWFEDGEELSDDDLNDSARRALNVELDCEQRTYNKILEYGLDYIINPTEYIQKSNAYIYFYLHVKSTRKFYTTGREPYNLKEVWSAAPDNFDGDYTIIPENLRIAFETYL